MKTETGLWIRKGYWGYRSNDDDNSATIANATNPIDSNGMDIPSDEVRFVIQRLKHNKAAGHCSLPVELFQVGGYKLVRYTYQVFYSKWLEESISTNWNIICSV